MRPVSEEGTDIVVDVALVGIVFEKWAALVWLLLPPAPDAAAECCAWLDTPNIFGSNPNIFGSNPPSIIFGSRLAKNFGSDNSFGSRPASNFGSSPISALGSRPAGILG